MSLGDVHIMMFYGRPKNVKFILRSQIHSITFIKAYHQEAKIIEFIQCLINFGEASQRRSNYVLK